MLDDLKMIHMRDVQDMLGVAGRQWQTLETAFDVPSSVDVTGLQSWCRDQLAQWEPQVATGRNPAKQLALELMGKSVVIYSGDALASAADRWKACINHNAKQLAWRGQLSDDEILGWTKQPVGKVYAVVELRSEFEGELVRKRFEACQRLLSGVRPAPITINASGETALHQVVYCSLLADFVSVYLALLNGINPAANDIIDKLNRS